MILTPSQKEKKRKDLEREKEEEARKRREELEVRCDSCLFRPECNSDPIAEGEEERGIRT